MAEFLLFVCFVIAAFAITHWKDISRVFKWRMAALKARKSKEKSEPNDAT